MSHFNLFSSTVSLDKLVAITDVTAITENSDEENVGVQNVTNVTASTSKGGGTSVQLHTSVRKQITFCNVCMHFHIMKQATNPLLDTRADYAAAMEVLVHTNQVEHSRGLLSGSTRCMQT